jgi:CheY-like chemotaxis protein
LIRVALVDDQELVRTGFRMVLEAQPDMIVVGEAADGLAAVTLAAGRPQPDVMVMDVRMPGLDGVQATRQICAACDRPRVLMLTTFDHRRPLPVRLHGAQHLPRPAGPAADHRRAPAFAAARPGRRGLPGHGDRGTPAGAARAYSRNALGTAVRPRWWPAR